MLLSINGILALALAAVGVYGLIGYSVTRRTSELGVRMALGATRVGILAMFMREALVVTGAGGLLGLLVVLDAARPLESLLPAGISTSDPASFAWALAVLLGIATVAAVVPALRAIRLDPIRALRYE